MPRGKSLKLGGLKRRALQQAKHHWSKLNWADHLSVVLALAFVFAISVSYTMRLFQKHSAARTAVSITALCFLITACLLYLVFGSAGPKRISWWAVLFIVSLLVEGIALVFIPGAQAYTDFVGSVMSLLWAVVFVVLLSRYVIESMSEDIGTWAARIVSLLMVSFCLVFPTLMIFLATNGNDAALVFLRSKPPGWFDVLPLLALSIAPVLLFAAPEYLRRMLAWSTTSERTKSITTNLLATGAALSTGLYALIIHFHAGPLAHAPLGSLAVGILFAVALLIPIYRSIIKVCWQRGSQHIVDLRRWRADWRDVLKEWRAAAKRLEGEREADSNHTDTNTSGRPHPDVRVTATETTVATEGHPSSRRRP